MGSGYGAGQGQGKISSVRKKITKSFIGFSLLKQRHALLDITENVSASALSNILTLKKIYSHRKQRRVAAVAAVPSTAIRPAAVAATPPA